MKYVCLLSQVWQVLKYVGEQANTVLDECFSHNDELRTNGVLVAEESVKRNAE